MYKRDSLKYQKMTISIVDALTNPSNYSPSINKSIELLVYNDLYVLFFHSIIPFPETPISLCHIASKQRLGKYFY